MTRSAADEPPEVPVPQVRAQTRCLEWLDGHSYRKCQLPLGHDERQHSPEAPLCGVALPDDADGLTCGLPFDHDDGDEHEGARIVRWKAAATDRQEQMTTAPIRCPVPACSGTLTAVGLADLSIDRKDDGTIDVAVIGFDTEYGVDFRCTKGHYPPPGDDSVIAAVDAYATNPTGRPTN